jgi:cell division protein FtsB
MQGLLPRVAVGVFGLLTVAMVLLAVFDDRGVLEVNKRHSELARIKTEIAALQQSNETLKKEIDDLRYDPATIERIAREQLKLVKPGEIILMTPEPETAK